MEKPSRQYGCKEPTSFTALKWSPHSPQLFAVASAANFGIVGKGAAQVRALDGPSIRTVAVLQEKKKDAVFDISWFELGDNRLLVGNGSGQVSMWDVGTGRSWVTPLRAQVHSVQCAYKTPLFIAGCLDGTVHVGDSQNGRVLFSLPAHTRNCNQVQWHPTSDKVFASGGADGLLKLWDHTLPRPNISSHRAHEVVTGSTDKTLRLWDLRNLAQPILVLPHHRYPPKRARFSPHLPWLLTSAGYDMNVHFYDLRDPKDPLKFRGNQHTEFVSGLDFSMFEDRLVGSAGWDGRILIWDFDQPQPIIK